ncbi:MAG TPA: peptidoglycan-binding domain-containing protein [Myxococcaceae bacterium]
MRPQLAAAGFLLLAIGCAHGDEASQSADGKNAQPPSDSVAPAKTPRSPPLAAAPSELLEPRSQETIARALKAKGVVARDDVRGEQLGAALRKFQADQGLAVTGYPDHETLRRLGVDPKDVETSLGGLPGTRPGETHSDNETPPKDRSGNSEPPKNSE